MVKVLAKKSKVFHSGGGLDFLEEDIVEIYSEASQQVLFSSKP